MGRVAKVAALLLLALLGACAHRTVRVDCDGPLRPINHAAPKDSHAAPKADQPTHSP